MRKGYFLLLLPVLLLALAGTSYGWQGRMGGMGDPYGLISDESDYLIHPAKIANGEGVRFYGDYRFTYTGVTDWDSDRDYYIAGVWVGSERTDISVDERAHNALLGAAFPLGPGRMGLFFTYNGMRGMYEGGYRSTGDSPYLIEMKSVLDDFALRLLYGLPLGDFKLGGEFQIAYCQEKKEPNDYKLATNEAWLNEFWDPLTTYMYPYDSSYWEALFKGSLGGKVGPFDLEFTLRGGFIFGGDNEWYSEYQIPIGNPSHGWNQDGAVAGWRIGGDVWVRYPLAGDLSLPFLVRVDYRTKTRDGDGPGFGDNDGNYYDYGHEERDLAITVGGGVDKEFTKDTRIAAGIYYNYLQRRENFVLDMINPSVGAWYTNDDIYPDSAEHQVLLRLAGEHSLSPAVTLRGGLSLFYGWVNPEGSFTYTNSNTIEDYSADGSGHGTRWGVGASLGGTVAFKAITLEPFISGGYQQLDLKGDGGISYAIGNVLFEQDDTRHEWYIGGGFSILYDL
jgi:hypothetical protein